MAALPDDFLKRVIEEAAAFKGIKDAQQNIKANDPVMAACCRLAYTQICEACNQPFHYGLRTQIFDDYFGPMLLRSVPIDRTKPVSVLIDGLEVLPTDWRISMNRLVLFNNTVIDTGYSSYHNVEFTSYCGIALIEDLPPLMAAVQVQALGNLHRKDVLGMADVQGEKGMVRRPVDSGELLDSTRQLISKIVYEGHAYSLDGE